MTTLQTTQDIVKDVLDRADELTDGSSDFDANALEYINRSYRELWMGGGPFSPDVNVDWWWLRDFGILTMVPAIEDQTIALTNNSTAAVLTATATADITGWFLKVDNVSDIFKVSAVTGTAVTLDSVWTGTTATGTADILPLEYTMATGMLRVLDPMKTDRSGHAEIKGMDIDEMEAAYPLSGIGQGIPTRYANVSESVVRFNAYEDELVRVRYPYLKQPADLVNTATDVPLVPLQYRSVLADMALYYLLHDKEDSREQKIVLQAQAGIKAMVNEHRRRQVRTGDVGAIRPRKPSGTDRPLLRTESGFIIG